MVCIQRVHVSYIQSAIFCTYTSKLSDRMRKTKTSAANAPNAGNIQQRKLSLFFIIRRFNHFYVCSALLRLPLLLLCHAFRFGFSIPSRADDCQGTRLGRKKNIWKNGTKNFFDSFPFKCKRKKAERR